MARANEIKRGMAISYNGKLLLVKDIDVQSPSARGASTLYKMRFSDVRTGLKVEERFKGASASARNKPATMATGLVIHVPEYLSAGDKIRIHIAERRYMSRAD